MTARPASERRGFAALSPQLRREIGRLGGKAVHARGTGHRFTSETGREAGKKKGGHASRIRGVDPRSTSAAAGEAGRVAGAAESTDHDQRSRIDRIGAERRNRLRMAERRRGGNGRSLSAESATDELVQPSLTAIDPTTEEKRS